MIQASTIEFSGFLHMTQFEHTDPEFNTNTRKWSAGIISRIQETLGEKDSHQVIRDAIAKIDAEIMKSFDKAEQLDGDAINEAIRELRKLILVIPGAAAA